MHSFRNAPVLTVTVFVPLLMLLLILASFLLPHSVHAADKTKIYLTFDDGPKLGTTEVLNVLKANNVTATFFLNGENLNPKIYGHERIEANRINLLRLVQEGHMLAEHSYDHMRLNLENEETGRNPYFDVEKDLSYFNNATLPYILDTLLNLELPSKSESLAQISHNLRHFARLPFTNNWRVDLENGVQIRHTMSKSCAYNTASLMSAAKLADRLHAEMKVQVVGWDLEWSMDYSTFEILLDAEEMLDYVESLRLDWKRPDKVVILTHDSAWGPKGKADADQQLAKFIRLALEKGYEFDTVQNYIAD